MRRVVTIDDRGLPELAQLLLSQMEADGFAPEGLVGIATGGARIVDAVPDHLGLERFTVSVRRASSQRKDEWTAVRSVVKSLPYSVLNGLRRLEDLALGRAPVSPPSTGESFEAEIQRIADWAAGRVVPRLVIMDDAVDSGETLRLVTERVREAAPTADVRSAVVSATRSGESMGARPDYVLYRQVLVRYPWSLDYKGPRAT